MNARNSSRVSSAFDDGLFHLSAGPDYANGMVILSGKAFESTTPAVSPRGCVAVVINDREPGTEFRIVATSDGATFRRLASIDNRGVPQLDGPTRREVGRGGRGAPLPRAPSGYLEVRIGDEPRLIPYYDPP